MTDTAPPPAGAASELAGGQPTPAGRGAALVDRAPPHLYFLISAVFHYLGPAFAVLLFARIDVLGVAWLRIASAAVIFAIWRRPWRAFAAQDRSGKRLLLAWGAVLAVMNACFYLGCRSGRSPPSSSCRSSPSPLSAPARRATSSRWRSRFRACTCSPTCN